MAQKIQDFWDKQAKRYDISEKQFGAVYERIIARTKEYLEAEDHVLDFGCATGTKTIELADAVKHIHGLDISAEMVNIALTKKNELNSKNISFSQGTIFNTELQTATYDKIIAYGIIYLLEDSGSAINRIHEILKPGGLFISTTACFKEKMNFKTRIQFLISLWMKKLGMLPLHLNMFKSQDVENLINNSNFRVIKSENIFDGMTISFIVAKKQ